jgi:hypothetical protein
MTTIIYGPQGSGKSMHAARLAKLFDCVRIIDDWDGETGLPRNALALTSSERFMPPLHAQVFSIGDALECLSQAKDAQ